jgi:hypothetical protein
MGVFDSLGQVSGDCVGKDVYHYSARALGFWTSDVP